MSLILEALRKSEAERQRAQAPGLHAPAPVHRPAAARPGWGPWVAVALGAALLGGTWWVNRPAPVPDATPAAVVAEAPPAGSESAAGPARMPVESAPPAAIEAPPPPLVVAPAEPVRPTLPPAPPAAAPEPVAPPDPPVAAAPAPAATEALPGLASLSTAERAALPPLKVSMHVWAADPARRFAIVDGNRVGEGGVLGGGIVAAIRTDGVVLELADGRRVLLARP